MKKHALIIGLSSDIGIAIARDFIRNGIVVSGTYRTESKELNAISKNLKHLFHLDLSFENSIQSIKQKIISSDLEWDYLILAPGTMLPIGEFLHTDFANWRESFDINFLAPSIWSIF